MSRKPSLNTILKHIITDTRTTTKAALEYAGKRVSDDFSKMATYALDGYYDEYTKPPRVYTRTNILHDSSYYKVNKRNGFSLRAGIVFDENLMEHKKAGISEYGILENFMQGIHGNEDVFVGISRRNLMDRYYNSYISRNKPYVYFCEYMNKHLNH